MNPARNFAWRAKHSAVCALSVLLALSVCAAAKGRPPRVTLFPRLQAGQTFAYQIRYHSDKHVKTESPVIVAAPADSFKIDVNALVSLEILGVQAQGERSVIHARTRFELLDSDSHPDLPDSALPAAPLQKQEPGEKFIDFTILPDGGLDQVTGLDALSPEQQQAWQEWASRFLLTAAFPTPGVRVSQKWNSDEQEKSPSPIAGLHWMRESTYVGDQPCRAVELTVQGSVATSDAGEETCAVILTTAALKQDSNARNATPMDFKLHELRTAGTAHGANRIITYVSLRTGLVIRASEEATQQMNVTVAKADGSNRVRYDVNGKSNSEVVLVVQSP